MDVLVTDLVRGLWFVAFGAWPLVTDLVRGLWFVAFGAWPLVRGFRCEP
jgi:hypothetical protein